MISRVSVCGPQSITNGQCVRQGNWLRSRQARPCVWMSRDFVAPRMLQISQCRVPRSMIKVLLCAAQVEMSGSRPLIVCQAFQRWGPRSEGELRVLQFQADGTAPEHSRCLTSRERECWRESYDAAAASKGPLAFLRWSRVPRTSRGCSRKERFWALVLESDRMK